MKILAVENEDNWRKFFKASFSNSPYELQMAENTDEAENAIKEIRPDIAIVNLNLFKNIPKDKSGKLVLAYIQDNYPDIPRIVVSGRGGSSKVLMEEFGVFDVLGKPFEIDELKEIMEKAIIKSNQKIFISYASEDYNIAKRLYDDLKREGITPWLDREDLVPGQNWKTTIPDIIRGKSSYFILLVSKNSVSKTGYIQKEQKIALGLLEEKPIDQIFIIPARLDNTEPIDEKLKNLHWADLTDYETGFNQILKSLQK